jgi:hypothetical protein
MTNPPASGAAGPAVIDGVDVDAVAAAVKACAGVAGLDGGRFGEVASYLPGRIVRGVVISGGRVTVQVRSRWGIPAPHLAALITAALAPLTRGRPVDVVIADIDDPPGTPQVREPADRNPGEPADRPSPAGTSPAGAPGSFPLPTQSGCEQ